jgi:hypothetical protein
MYVVVSLNLRRGEYAVVYVIENVKKMVNTTVSIQL